jgi:type IV secretion system protein VirB11
MTHEALPLLQHALEPIAEWWEDPAVEDILMQRPNEVFVRRSGEVTCHEVSLDFIDQEGIAILAGSLKQQNVGKKNPLLSCDLPGGTRLQAVLPPCVREGTVALAFRRPKQVAPTLEEVKAGGLFSEIVPTRGGVSPVDDTLVRLYLEAERTTDVAGCEDAWMAFLTACVRAGKTIMMCGQVGSGKTHLAMALANAIPLDTRLVTIQDADEWAALPHRNRVDLFYSKGGQSAAHLTPNDLVECSLRLAMKWLLMQEIRGEEAYSFMRARRSGHPGISTCHAKNALDVYPTLALMVKQHPAANGSDVRDIERMLHDLIDVTIHLHRPDEKRFAISQVHFETADRLGATAPALSN